MILYFSGTNNSHYVADRLGQIFGDRVFSIGAANRNHQYDFALEDNERLGIVCPVHAWNLPYIMNIFLPKMNIANYKSQYVFGVFTCGANDGNCDRDLKKLLGSKGIVLNATYAVVMPDNYIPMYDVPSSQEQIETLKDADIAIDSIVSHIKSADKINIHTKKNPPRFFSSMLSKAYLGLRNSKDFFVTDACISCGICAANCPMSTISMVGGRPVWKGDCTKCLKCIHYCPTKAIQMNKNTAKRGRYHNPHYPNP